VDAFIRMAVDLSKVHGEDLKVELRWISAHSGVAGNERVDEEAKKASQGDVTNYDRLPPFLRNHVYGQSVAAIKQEYGRSLKTEWSERWKKSPRYKKASKVDSSFPFQKFRKAADGLSRAQTSILTQLRTGHIALNSYLARIHKVDSPLCSACKRSIESVHHYLFECPAYRNERHVLSQALGRKARSLRYLLGNEKGMKELLRYVGRTKRFTQGFGEVSPHDVS
jgi:hypothetical protein